MVSQFLLYLLFCLLETEETGKVAKGEPVDSTVKSLMLYYIHPSISITRIKGWLPREVFTTLKINLKFCYSFLVPVLVDIILLKLCKIPK